MKFFELLKFSLGNLWRRKLRTVLTVLGVMIGAASIVVMMSIGIGLNKSFIDSIQNSGTLTLINVNNYMYDSKSPDSMAITKDSVAEFAALEHVTAASPLYGFSILAKSGGYQADIYVNAMSLDMLHALNLPLLKGALPNEGDSPMLIAGAQIGNWFYDPNATGEDMYVYGDGTQEPLVDLYETPVFAIYDMDSFYSGQTVKKHLLQTAAIMGVKQTEDAQYYSDYDYNCYMDLDAIENLFNKMFKGRAWPNQMVDSKGKPVKPISYNEAYVLVDDINNVSAVQKQIIEMGYQASSQVEYLEMMKKESRTIQYVLGGIGSVSLIVAAIGITNTMLMSIFERTKEIGIFKVLGCSLGNIRSMFLCEAGAIGFAGGVLGLALSYLLSFAINLVTGQTISSIPIWLDIVGMCFSVLVGMIAGISPAIRATKLSPLEAIRTL